MTKRETVFSKDLKNKKLTVVRSFDASPEQVWQAWTESDILDQWWAPKPYKAETKAMDFREGGHWLYCMLGPEGDRSWSREDFAKIVPQQHIGSTAVFCDEAGVPNKETPEMHWTKDFKATGDATEVNIVLTFDKEADLQWIINMGFQEGFTAGLSNLDHYIETRFKLRGEMKTGNRARACSYLNFPGNTEEAFLFYKDVFNGEFTGAGLQRFADVPAPEGMPPMSDDMKQLIIHAELTIMGGYVLMATDAPESMGFKLTSGNNMHINLEPESREETERLFNALSAGGTVTMPLEDMFWGAYFAEFTDKYGINWMLNYQPKG